MWQCHWHGLGHRLQELSPGALGVYQAGHRMDVLAAPD